MCARNMKIYVTLGFIPSLCFSSEMIVRTGQNSTLEHSTIAGRNIEVIEVIDGGTLTTNVNKALRFPFAGDENAKTIITVKGVDPISKTPSIWNSNAPLYIGGFHSRLKYNADLNVMNGGVVNANGAIVLGRGLANTGVINIDGPGSVLNSSSINNGVEGVGIINISNGGRVFTSNGLSIGYTYFKTITNENIISDKSSVITMDNGTLSTLGAIFVGNGKVELKNNSRVSATEISLGHESASISVDNGELDAPVINNGGKVYFSGVNYYSGNINGTGKVNVNTGITVLTGDNTYSGGTTISNGTLQLGNGGNTGSVIGAILNNGMLAVNRSDALTLEGNISGAGSLLQQGSGTTVLTGANTYSGGTTISNGTLQLGNGGNTGSVIGDILNNGMLAVNRSDALTLEGKISGAGSLLQQGSGTTVLTGANTYSGGTTISNGTLKLGVENVLGNTSIVKVEENSTLNLGGHSQFMGAESRRFDNSGIILINDPAASLLLKPITVAGDMILNSKGSVILNNGVAHAGQTYVQKGDWIGKGGILSLGAVLDGANSVADTLDITGHASGNTQVVVTKEKGGEGDMDGLLLINTGSSDSKAFSMTNRVVGGSRDYFLRQGDISGNNKNKWFLTTWGFRPERGSYAANLAAAATMFDTRLNDRRGREYTDPITGEVYHSSLWARTVGGYTKGRLSDTQSSMSANRMIFQLGGNVLSGSLNGSDSLHIGLMGGYGNQHSTTQNALSGYQSRGSVSGYSSGIYATWYQDEQRRIGFYADSWLQYGWFDNTVKGDGLAYEKYNSSGLSASLEGGYVWHVGSYNTAGGMENKVFLRPQAQFLWSGVKADGHTEQNGTFVQGTGSDNVKTRVGLRLSMTGQSNINRGSVQTFEPFVEANWVNNSKQYGVRMGGENTYISGTRNTGEVSAGVEGRLTERFGMWGRVTHQMGTEGYRDTQGVLGVKYNFR